MHAISHGLLLSLGLILPLGVQNLFIFTQGMTQHALLRLLPVILTAALCDTLLIVAAVQGTSAVLNYITWLKSALVAGGAVFLGYIGWLTWQSTPLAAPNQAAPTTSVKQNILFTLSVSLLNPHAILDTIGVIGTSSAQYAGASKWLFTGACITVSWLWFFGLAAAGRILGGTERLGPLLRYLNKASAVFIWLSALYLCSQLVPW